jgi:hypothetical protein
MLTICGKFTDSALGWWLNYTSNYTTRMSACSNLKVSEFLDVFRKQFMPRHAAQSMFVRLANEKQGSKTPQEFVDTFRKRALWFKSGDPETLAHLLMNGLNSRTRDRLHAMGTDTLNYALLVRQLEEFEEENGPKIAARAITTATKLESTSNSTVTCFSCGKMGHYQRDCRTRKSRKVDSRKSKFGKRTKAGVCKIIFMNSTENKINSIGGNVNKPLTFIIDSGASNHILGSDFEKLTANNFSMESGTSATTVDGSVLDTFVVDEINFVSELNKILGFYNCLFVPHSNCNLISVTTLLQNDYKINFDVHECRVYKDNVLVFIGRLDKGDNLMKVSLTYENENSDEQKNLISLLSAVKHMKEFRGNSHIESYGLTEENDGGQMLTVRENAQPLTEKLKLWHETFGHCGSAKLQQLLNQIDKSNKSNCPKDFYCESCQVSKQTRKIKLSTPMQGKYELCEVIHMDVVGPLRTAGLKGEKYALNLIEETTRFCVSYCLPTKEAPLIMEKIMHTINWLENQLGVRVKVLRSDQGSEFTFKELEEKCKQRGIVQQFTNAYSPSQNGTVERLNRTLMDTVRVWMVDTKMPTELWSELYTHAVYIYNHRPHKHFENKLSPAQAMFKEGKLAFPVLKCLHPIGSKVVMSDHYQKVRSKVGKTASTGWYIGLAEQQPGIKMWDDVTFTVRSSKHFSVWHKENYRVHAVASSNGDEEASDARKSHRPQLEDSDDPASHNEATEDYLIERILDEEFDSHGEKRYRVRWLGYDESQDTYEPYEGICHTDAFRKWEDPTYEPELLSLINITDDEYPTLKKALEGNNRDSWLDAMQLEYDALIENGTWEVVPRPKFRKTISVKWVLRVKWDGARTVPLFKARLCARGFNQVYKLDYDETFAPTLSKTGLRLALAVAVQAGMHIHTVDCKNAFLNGFIDKEIYIEQPPHFIQKGTTAESHVCKVIKSIYGLKQAPLIWCQTAREALKQGGFEQMKHEPCLFVRRSASSKKRKLEGGFSWDQLTEDPELCILGVYVDDITIMSPTMTGVENAKKTISDAFKIKDLGEIAQVIGMEFTKVNDGYLIHQKSKIESILKGQKMEKANHGKIPMEPTAVSTMTADVTGSEGVTPVDNHWYRSIVGELLYIAICTRPDLSFAVSMCARQVESPDSRHKSAITKILKYCRATSEHGLMYKRSSKEPRLIAHSDSDFAMDKSDSKSTSGFVVSLGNCMISWYSGKQKAVSTSTVEAEYIAAGAATKEVIWLQYLLTELTGATTLRSPLLLLDNAGAESLAQNDKVSNKTKHIRYTYHFIRDCARSKLVELKHVPGVDNPADMMTKPLASEKFLKFRKAVNVKTASEANLEGEFLDRTGYLKPKDTTQL